MKRREFLVAGAVAAATPATAGQPAAGGVFPPAAFTLSINVELMFPREMKRGDRIRRVAAHGVKAFGFWQPVDEAEERGMLKAQQDTGLRCSIVNGSGANGYTTGFTTPGHEEVYFQQFTAGVQRAKRFESPHANTFVGLYRRDVPWAEQRRLILEGIKRCADIARRHNVIMTLEPLYRAGPDRPAIHTAATAFDIVDTLNDPNVRVCFDVFHLQLNEGNLTNNLKLGLEKGWIRMVQTGDVPGRKEPGTGEINHVHLLRTLREIGYAGYVDTEHGTSTTADETIEFCKRLVAQA